MKYIIVLGDGMADEPLEELGGRTPLEAAHTPTMDEMAGVSEIGLAKMIPSGMKPGSDTANLAVLGYDPIKYYSGRSPLEALSIGVDMKEKDVALRCNLVTLSEDSIPFEQKTILDHSSGEITTEDCEVLLDVLKKEMEKEPYRFYLGTSYRHCLIWSGGEVIDLAQPHDILGKVIGPYLPVQPDLRFMAEKSYELLNQHPLNIERAAKGLNKANCAWFWGAGTKPRLDSFYGRTGKLGAMISAVDLLKGIAVGIGMKIVEVDGMNGTLHTNYEGKAEAAAKVLLEENKDFVYIHVEAPDEMGHQGNIKNKVKAIEEIDSRVIRLVKKRMDESGEPYRMMVLPDHPTPICYRTHTSDPIPYLLYDSQRHIKRAGYYNEREAKEAGNFETEGYRLINRLFMP